jgi:drug/metabolite transporter (DMT)-like permease
VSKKKITFLIFIALIFSDVLETATQFCFKKSALSSQHFVDVANISTILLFLKGAFSSPFLWLGLLSVVLTFTIWSTILSKIDLSVAVPVASFSYILVGFVSIFFLHEKIVFLRWVGILFILGGIIFVSLTSHQES